MLLAIELARKSVRENRPDPPPMVGAVVVKDGEQLSGAYRGEAGDGAHAEYGALRHLDPDALRDATVYTTLEPCCAGRSEDKTSCAERLIRGGVSVVHIGMYDPNPAINRRGWKTLFDAGVIPRDFDGDLRAQIEDLNADFIAQYRRGQRDAGSAKFDYEQAGGLFEVETSLGVVRTRWGPAGRNAVYAYESGSGYPALAKLAESFESIDDPGAYDFSHHGVHAGVGEIVVFQAEARYLLVKVEAVKSSLAGDVHSLLEMSWEARRPGRASAGVPPEVPI